MGWELVRLIDVARLESGHTPARDRPKYWGGDIPWVSLHDSDFLDLPRIYDTSQRTTALGIANSSARLLPAGSVLFSRTATVGKATILGRDGATSQDFANYVCGPRVHNEYLMYLFRYMQPEWTRLMAGSTHNTIYMPVFKALQVLLPPAAEQRAIAAALSDVDGLIASLDRLIAKKRAIKQAAMQQLLTGKTRLPGFKGKWAKQRLGTIARITMGRTPSRGIGKFWGPGHRWLAISDLHGRTVSDTAEQITDAGADGIEGIPAGTLVMSFKLSIGRVAFTGTDMYSNEAICALRAPQVDPTFLYYALQRVDFSLYGKQAVKGYTLNKQSLKTVEVYGPIDPAEQHAVGKVLHEADDDVEAAERLRDKTKAIKQGMMQALLTGRVRLPAKAAAGGTA